ncbi:MAG TPA: SpoIVB peptidase S55 domain-containing protein [Thermoanaerobaculia bacterium]|nr:SpoIVB peptidase S55 domain-containing protein [Thermoanaerobaculia bacterium]
MTRSQRRGEATGGNDFENVEMNGVELTVATVVRSIVFLIATALLLPSVAHSADILPLSEVRKGMRGHGLTVFDGATVERFDIEILGILNNVGPRQDIILVRVDSPVTDKAGIIAGMSGSPVYVDGKVVGALAYGWQFSSEAIAGVTPIEEMLRIGTGRAGRASSASPVMSGSAFLSSLVDRDPLRQLDDVMKGFTAGQVSALGSALPIAVPLSFSRFAPDTVARFSRYFDSAGFVAVPSGSAAARETASVVFSPGDAVAGVLVDGDFSIAATGTVTHVEGDRVYAFGHPFLNLGEISFPMAKSDIVAVLPNLATSAKFANRGPIVGTFKEDRFAGILGIMNVDAETIPVTLSLDGAGERQTFDFQVVRHPQLSPLIIAMATDSVVAIAQRAAGERTILLDSEIAIDGFPPIRLRDGWAGASARQAIPAYLAIVSSYLLSNEFHDAGIRSVKINLHHTDELRIAKVLEASVETPPSGSIRPGDTIGVRVLLKPFRGEPFTERFEIRVPESQRPGNVHLYVGGGSVINQLEFSLVPPDPRTLQQVVGVIERLHSATELLVGLYSTADGAVTAGVYLPTLPPSIRAVVEADSSNAPKIPVRYHAVEKQSRSLDSIIEGALKVDLQIRPRS